MEWRIISFATVLVCRTLFDNDPTTDKVLEAERREEVLLFFPLSSDPAFSVGAASPPTSLIP